VFKKIQWFKILLAALPLAAYGQVVNLGAPAPPAPSPNATVAGATGFAQYGYYVVAHYPTGTTVSPQVSVSNAAATLSSPNHVTIGWAALPNVLNYDVLRVPVGQLVPSTCTCAVVTLTTSTVVNDIGGALAAYTLYNPVQQATTSIYLDNQRFIPPEVRQVVNGVDLPMAGYTQSLSNIHQIVFNGQRVDHCHQCLPATAPGALPPNPLIFDSNAAGATCSTGGHAFQLWSMAEDGSNKINLTATHSVLAALTTKNEGQAKFDPTGKLVIFQVQGSTSTAACNSAGANPGAGFDQNVFICDYPNFVACTQQTTYAMNAGLGVLHPELTNNFAYWMAVTGAGGVSGGVNFHGNFSFAPFSIAAGVPTIGTITVCGPGACGMPAATPNWFETTGRDPNSLDSVFFTSGNTFTNTNIYKFDLNRGAFVNAVSNTNATTYTEFWNCDDTGSLALSMSSEFTPSPTFTSVPFTDLILGTCSTGLKRIPLTTYNTPGTSQYISTGVVVSLPVWGAGQKYIYYTIQQGGMVSTIWMASFNGAATHTFGAIKQ
jgi:hypothetical protein